MTRYNDTYAETVLANGAEESIQVVGRTHVVREQIIEINVDAMELVRDVDTIKLVLNYGGQRSKSVTFIK